MSKPKPTQDKKFSTLFPGQELELDGVKMTVYPLGFRHIKKFGQRLAAALSLVGNTAFKKNEDPKEIGKKVLAQLGPLLLSDFLDLLEDCVVFEIEDVTLEDLPHWHIASVAEVWLLESFGEEKKLKPWVTMVQSVMSRFTETKTIESVMPSNSSFPADTQLTES